MTRLSDTSCARAHTSVDDLLAVDIYSHGDFRHRRQPQQKVMLQGRNLSWGSSLDHLHRAREGRFAADEQILLFVASSSLFTLFRAHFERLVSCTLTWSDFWEDKSRLDVLRVG